MTKAETIARNLSPEARTALINTDWGRAATLVVPGTSALVSNELMEAGCLAPASMLLTTRGEIVREFVLDLKLDAMDPPAVSRPESREVLGGPLFAEDVADPRDKLVQAAKEWRAHLTVSERDLLVEQGDQTPTGRLYRAIQALR
jgi:hypothetical protein